MKKIFLILLISFCVSTARAEDFEKAVCRDISGKGISYKNDKQSYSDEKISNPIVFYFDWNNAKAIDDSGNEYVVINGKYTVTLLTQALLSDEIITFYKQESKIVLSKHNYWKGFDDIAEADILSKNMPDISSWTMLGNCEFF